MRKKMNNLEKRLEQRKEVDGCFGQYEKRICRSPKTNKRCGFEKECATATMLLKGAKINPSCRNPEASE